MTKRTITVELSERDLRYLGNALRDYKAHLMKLPTNYALLNETAGERVHGVQGLHDRIAQAFIDLREGTGDIDRHRLAEAVHNFMVDSPPNTKVNDIY